MNTSSNSKYLSVFLERILFKKSLLKGYVRRQIPIPFDLKLNRPIFIIGSSRSGTSILTDVLSSSPELLNFTEHPVVRRHMWHMVKYPEVVLEELPKLAKTLKRLSGIKSNQRLLEKSPGHSLLAKQLSDYFVDAKFIHIVRDGRDVAFSMLKHEWIADELKEIHSVFWFDLLPLEFKDEWESLDLWKRAVLRWAVYVNTARQISSYQKKYLEVRYEKLCLAPQEMITYIGYFLNLNDVSPIEKAAAQIGSARVKNWRNTKIEESQMKFYQRVLLSFGLINEYD